MQIELVCLAYMLDLLYNLEGVSLDLQLPFLLTIRAIKHLLALLEPHRKENGGVLSVEHIRLVIGI